MTSDPSSNGPFRGFARALLVAGVGLLALLTLSPQAALAHALLERSSPAEDTLLKSSPQFVHLWFTEDLNPGASKIVVWDRHRHVVSIGNAKVVSGQPHQMYIPVKPLKPGSYLVLWTSVSAQDGHVLHGYYLFSVKVRGPGPSLAGVSTDTGQGFPDQQVMASLIAHFFELLGSVVWLGAAFFSAIILPLVARRIDEQGSSHRGTTTPDNDTSRIGSALCWQSRRYCASSVCNRRQLVFNFHEQHAVKRFFRSVRAALDRPASRCLDCPCLGIARSFSSSPSTSTPSARSRTWIAVFAGHTCSSGVRIHVPIGGEWACSLLIGRRGVRQPHRFPIGLLRLVAPLGCGPLVRRSDLHRDRADSCFCGGQRVAHSNASVSRRPQSFLSNRLRKHRHRWVNRNL